MRRKEKKIPRRKTTQPALRYTPKNKRLGGAACPKQLLPREWGVCLWDGPENARLAQPPPNGSLPRRREEERAQGEARRNQNFGKDSLLTK